jgi:hypothetical protein
MNKKANVNPTTEASSKKNIIALGWVSFFGGMSQDMIVPILPIYYAHILGIS